eukprot:m51a1_g5557 guanosine-3',5'-bis(diphosphate) 3'-diphosphatase, putative (350) ;mRNA; f:558855-560930
MSSNDVEVALRMRGYEYLRQHAELGELLRLFISDLLEQRPEDPVHFASQFFASPDLPSRLSSQVTAAERAKRHKQSWRKRHEASCKLFVGNLCYACAAPRAHSAAATAADAQGTRRDAVADMLGRYGAVACVTGWTGSYCFVVFRSAAAASFAFDRLSHPQEGFEERNAVHVAQRRKGPTAAPYINHPLSVAYELTSAGVTDISTLQAALLHDTVEDTGTTLEEIEGQFGRAVRDVVAEVSDDKSLSKRARKELQVQHAPHRSHAAKLVKLGDKISNIRDLVGGCSPWDEQVTTGYIVWALKVVDGLRGTNAVLEKRFDSLVESYSAMPPPEARDRVLQAYYDTMSKLA